MTHLANLAIRLFQNEQSVSDSAFDPDAYDWDDHYATLREAVELSDDDRNHLLGFCLDIAVHLATTAEVAFGPGFSSSVIADWDGRGWEAFTKRSGTVQPTVTAIPGCSTRDPWASSAMKSSSVDATGISAIEHEALWRSLLSDEPAEGPPL